MTSRESPIHSRGLVLVCVTAGSNNAGGKVQILFSHTQGLKTSSQNRHTRQAKGSKSTPMQTQAKYFSCGSMRVVMYNKAALWLSLAVAAQTVLLFTWYNILNKPMNRREEFTAVGNDAMFNWNQVPSTKLLVDWSEVKTYKKLMTDIDWTAIKKKPKPSQLHDKWVVVTSINKPTSDIAKLAKMDGWKVVVVGDTKSPPDWSHPNCVFLSVDDQKKLGYRIVDYISYRNYARKNIGYLYAIQHGAKQIYDTDDDNHATSGKITFFEKDSGEFLVYSTHAKIVNPYSQFGQSTIWPRGYPLDKISEPNVHTFDKCQDVSTPIQQGVVDGDPDVDAIYRLTRKDKDVRLDVKFDPKAPPVLLPPGTMAPFNSQNTFFLHKGLWALLLPATKNLRTTDIWRGYFDQRLLWEIGEYLSYFPPNAVQVRSPHNYHDDFVDEKELYHDAGRLVEFLNKWKSDKKDFFSRVMELSVAMAENKFWGIRDALLTEAWLHDLISFGYEMPALNPTPKKCKKAMQTDITVKPHEQPSSHLRGGKKLVLIQG